MKSRQFPRIAPTWAALLGLACFSCEVGEHLREEETTDSGVLRAPVSCTDLPKTRGPAESCCPAHGPDACGANLFCAALDGRTVPTCYVVGTQAPGRQCHADEQCASQSCNRQTGRCRGVLGTACDENTGCKGSACYQGTCEPTTGIGLAICDSDEQCKSGMVCRHGRCGLENGKTCGTTGTQVCSSGYCATSSSSNQGTCVACKSNAECAGPYNQPFRVCRDGFCVRTCKSDDHCAGMNQENSACPYFGTGCVPFTCEEIAANGTGVCR